MMRAIGFAQGQLGDLAIMTVACRAFKEAFPDSHLTFGIADRYRDALPLFAMHPHIDAFHTWSAYDNWPDQTDLDYIRWGRFDRVYHAMPPHLSADWYNHRTYGQEACVRFGLPIPADQSYQLTPWQTLRKDCKRVVTLSLFPSKGAQMSKGLTIAEAEKLCLALKALGYTPIQLGGRFEPKLENAVAPSMSILEATTLMLSSKLHLSADTGFASIAGAYNAPLVGFYGNRNYPDQLDCASHLPPNRNAHYLRNVIPNEVTADQLIATAREKGLLP